MDFFDFFKYFGWALLGNLAYITLRLKNDWAEFNSGRKKKGTKEFLNYWWGKNQFEEYATLVQIIILIIMAPTFFEKWLGCHIHEGSLLYTYYSLLVGYATYSMWYQLIGIIKTPFKK